MEYRNDLADVLLNGLPDDERNHVIATINKVDAEKLRRKRAAGDEGMAAGTDLDADLDAEDDVDEIDDDLSVRSRVPRQG